MGRAAKADVLANDPEGPFDVVSSSDLPIDDKSSVPRALSVEEINEFVKDYAKAAQNAIEAGFDGVEIHGANGYLIDQFTQNTCNNRTDEYGGSVENNSRFCLEVVKAVVDAVGGSRVGIRLSPWSPFQGMRIADTALLKRQFGYLIREIRKFGLSYLHLLEPWISGDLDVSKSQDKESLDFAFDAWGSTADAPIMVAGGYNPTTARYAVDEHPTYQHQNVAVVFGRLFISNPDLPFRILQGLPTAKYDRDTFYTPKKEKGYNDYPFSAEYLKTMARS
jgi:NADPH2 dehydrogenase